MIARRFDIVPEQNQSLSTDTNRLSDSNEIYGVSSTEWPSLDAQLWEQACESVVELRQNGFFCVRHACDFEDVDLLWSLLTYAYGNLQFGSQSLAEWFQTVPEIRQRLGMERLTSSDIRKFRRNNRKILTLSLEGYFKKRSSSRVQRLRRTCGLSEWDLAEASVLEAIRGDLGEVDD